MSHYQIPSQRSLDRTKHVWVRHDAAGAGTYKCVLCGGLSYAPGDDVTCRRYEELTDDERRLCPHRAGVTT